MHHRFQSR